VTAPTLASLRLSPPDAADLRWLLLRDYEGDLGVKSGLGPMLDHAARMVHATKTENPHVMELHEPPAFRRWDVDETVIRAASRLRRLLAQWSALDPGHRLALSLVYASTRRELPEWGDLGPLVLRSDVAIAAHERSKSPRSLEAWLARLNARPAVAKTTAAIRRDADTRLHDACRAWERTYRKERTRAA
jgi:hypothetical protein